MTQAKLMLYLIATVVLLNCVNGTAQKNCNENSGYYWRDYINEIPSDAVLGGTDKKGNPTYVGQTLHPGGCILSGYINVDQQRIFYEYQLREHSTTKDVKILCSLQAKQLQWITKQSGDSAENLGENNSLIVCGHDGALPLTIGRKTVPSGEIVLGNVSIKDKKFQTLYFAHNGQGFGDNGLYEVLVYNSTVGEDPSEPEPGQGECNSKIVNINVY